MKYNKLLLNLLMNHSSVFLASVVSQCVQRGCAAQNRKISPHLCARNNTISSFSLFLQYYYRLVLVQASQVRGSPALTLRGEIHPSI